jgi:hypothetical protein
MSNLKPFKPKTTLEYRTALQDYLVARGSRLNNFRPGSRISTLMDAIAFVLALSDMDTLNGFKYAIMEGVYAAFGFPRLPGLKAVGIIRIEHEGHMDPIPIPQFEIDLFGLKFESVGSTEIPVGATFSEIEVRALRNGVDYNIQAARIDTSDGLGTLNINVPQGTRFWNPFDFSGGTELESEESRLQRFQNFIVNLGRSTPVGVYNGARSVPGVAGVQLIASVNPFSEEVEPGWVNLFISDGTSDPPQSLLDLVKKTIEGDLNDQINFPGYAAAGTIVTVGPIPISGITFEYQLEYISTSRLTPEEAIDIANRALVRYINTLPVGFDVLLQQVKASILRAHPDFYRVNPIAFYSRVVNPMAPVIGEWLPGNVFEAQSNTVPLVLPVPPPSDSVSVETNYLPRTMGISGGLITGSAIKVVPA